uniref:Heat shock 70 kDa protein 12A n=1 Tax=Fundulus heteroclitus TaxID=8078 RepID=A0A3Q2R2E8_FUNHE
MGDSYVIAIDFGTAFSGYAFNITPSGEESEIYLKRWGMEHGEDTPKTPTCILFGENEEFLKFGYEAKSAYINMRSEAAKKHYFFEDFKMKLYDKNCSSNLEIKAANGKSMKALKVFLESLKFLKKDALTTINSHTAVELIDSDFTWVLTVPAIWAPSAKQFMREAATQAGIVTEGTEDKLVIALEPEAASIWCKKLPPYGFITQNHNKESLDQSPGTQYIVVDCGRSGGTIDITVHEVMEGGALKELHKASGNTLGGQTVDENFKRFLRKILPDGVWDEYEQKQPSGAHKIMYEFTRLKQVDQDVQLCVPFTLGSLAMQKSGTEDFIASEQGASWDDGFIKISRDKLRSFFDESLQGITDTLRQIFKSSFNIKYILLVGGYAQSQILRQHITDQFGNRCKVLCPFRAQEAIVRGAVEFVRFPNVLVSRKMSSTYGFAVCEKFDKSKHKEKKKFTSNGFDYSRDVFRTLVEEGEDVGPNDTREFLCSPAEVDQTEMKLRFYSTLRKDPVYVDDWGVEVVGIFNVKVNGGDKVNLQVMFGSTEITATGTNQVSKEKQTIKIEFMTNE